MPLHLSSCTVAILLACLSFVPALRAGEASKPGSKVVRSAKSGAWSQPATWAGRKIPGAGDKVLIRTGDTVTYDLQSPAVIRSVTVSGTLTFARDRDTLLVVGLLKIQPGDDTSEEGFDCEAHAPAPKPGQVRPALEVGTPDHPIDVKHSATIRLAHVKGMDPLSCPAIVCCGGRMDFHGAPMSRTWLKLGATAKKGDTQVTLAEKVTGWRAGDRLVLTSTDNPDYDKGQQSEERTIRTLSDRTITLDRPLSSKHLGEGDFRGEVANLSRNVVVESANPKGVRGHTMYHRHSAGAISYAEFRHLGKKGVLGRYSLHYHLVGNTMRGSSVVGASIWDSQNRWLTIHGTNYLVVRDCVGFRSVGHGFFFEDGTEVHNVLDRNLAIGATSGKPLPKQVLPFDGNEGTGFWWANSLNTFTRNVACENHRYGFRFEATKTSNFNPILPVLQSDGTRKKVDIRTLPFVRFDDNEAHSDGLYGFNLGEGVNRVGPDTRHPFIIRRMKLWAIHYAFRPQSPSVLVEDMKIDRSVYGVYHPNYDNHVYRNLTINGDGSEPFNRGHDDISVQYGPVTVDGLTFTATGGYPNSIPLIQMSDDNPTGKAVTHIRNLKVVRFDNKNRRPVVTIGGGEIVTPKTPQGVPVYLHDYYGPNRHAKVVLTSAKDFGKDGLTYRAESPLTGEASRVAEVKDLPFPQLLDPVHDLPPTTVITHVRHQDGRLVVYGTASSNASVRRVVVNGIEARSLTPNFAQWQVTIKDAKTLTAHAEDAAGNVEKTPHLVVVATSPYLTLPRGRPSAAGGPAQPGRTGRR